MSPEIHLQLAGALQIALAMLHLGFPKRFQWKDELSRLSILNRQIFIVHTFFICIVMALMGALSLFAPQALLQPTSLSRLVLAGFACFWGLRLIVQWLVYDSSLWRGNSFERLIHFLFTVLWIYLSAVYAGIFYMQRR